MTLLVLRSHDSTIVLLGDALGDLDDVEWVAIVAAGDRDDSQPRQPPRRTDGQRGPECSRPGDCF